jgi:ABC-2 type transport system permease protein
MNWLRVRELIRKEFIQLFRDKKNRPLLVVAPLVQLLIFGYVVTTDVRDIRTAIFDQSHTKESRILIDAFNANKTFRVTHYLRSAQDLEKMLLDRKVDLGVKIGPDFSERIRKKETSPIQILADGSMSNMASIRIAYTSIVLNRLNEELIRQLYHQRLEYGKIDARIRTWYNPNLDSRDFYVPGIVAVLVMIISLLFTSMATPIASLQWPRWSWSLPSPYSGFPFP